ncbi:MAG: HPr family phosphocarrier protein [Candidatus Omnitrophica bacterium]|nr:HPr family phosphocarrier protein [Candidatus Omnitrophota bacterium]
MKPRNTKHKRILFVYRDFPAGTPGYEATVCIVESLKEKYDITTYCNLDEKVIELVTSVPSDQRFCAMVTNVPYKPSAGRPMGAVGRHMRETIELSESYQDSLLILRQIKLAGDIPIIAYTGAGDSSLVANIFWEIGGVDHIVPKTIDAQKDSEDICRALEKIIQDYEKLPSAIPEPILETEGGYTKVKVRVNLNGGLGLASAGVILKECGAYRGDVLLKRIGDTKEIETHDVKSALDLLSAAISEGEKITIFVEGLDEKAKILAKRLYSAFSCRYPFAINMERFI